MPHRCGRPGPGGGVARLIAACTAAGVNVFAVHARKAWLQGLSPKENRNVPPLDYDLVYRIKRENPALTIMVNGGIAYIGRNAKPSGPC